MSHSTNHGFGFLNLLSVEWKEQGTHRQLYTSLASIYLITLYDDIILPWRESSGHFHGCCRTRALRTGLAAPAILSRWHNNAHGTGIERSTAAPAIEGRRRRMMMMLLRRFPQRAAFARGIAVAWRLSIQSGRSLWSLWISSSPMAVGGQCIMLSIKNEHFVGTKLEKTCLGDGADTVIQG